MPTGQCFPGKSSIHFHQVQGFGTYPSKDENRKQSRKSIRFICHKFKSGCNSLKLGCQGHGKSVRETSSASAYPPRSPGRPSPRQPQRIYQRQCPNVITRICNKQQQNSNYVQAINCTHPHHNMLKLDIWKARFLCFQSGCQMALLFSIRRRFLARQSRSLRF